MGVAWVMYVALVRATGCCHDLCDGLVGEVGHCDGWAVPCIGRWCWCLLVLDNIASG
jgi:hypothetical protein